MQSKLTPNDSTQIFVPPNENFLYKKERAASESIQFVDMHFRLFLISLLTVNVANALVRDALRQMGVLSAAGAKAPPGIASNTK